MRKRLKIHVLVLLSLGLASWLLFVQVLDTGFWSPEDFHELKALSQSHTEGRLTEVFRPMLAGGYPFNPILALEFRFFGSDARSYYIFNLIIHILNSYLAYLLVNSLLHNRRNAFLAALLFALGVGSYGKNLMAATGVSSLIYAMACLLATLLYVWNEKKNSGRLLGLYSVGFFMILMMSLFMRGGTFSILASIAFYNFFFRSERERPVLDTNLKISLGIAACALILRFLVRGQDPIGSDVDPGAFLRNLPGYLILMVFPIHQSELLASAPAVVRWLYQAAPYIRVFVGLTILSYSVFGFIFGSRAIRFYIAWIYVMVVPFAVFRYPADWLNLRFLYLVSLGFCVLLTTGTFYAYRLLAHRRFRRLIPFLIPAFYIAVSVALVSQLDRKNEILAQRSEHERARTATQDPGSETRLP